MNEARAGASQLFARIGRLFSAREQVDAWRVHVGVHKTATTHLQDLIETSAEPLLRHGVVYLSRRFMRAHEVIRWIRRDGEAAWSGLSALRERLASAARGPRTVAMSEENWLGGARAALFETPYPEAEENIRALAAATRDAPLTLFLSLRSFGEVLPGAYATALRFQPMPGGFEPVRRRTLESPPSWVDLVERIRRAAPHATLRVWRYEDYRANSLRIASEVCGAPVETAGGLPDPVKTRTPGARAIAEAERLPDDLDPTERQARVEAIYRASFAAGEPKYAPFSPDETRRLDTAYAEDCARLSALAPRLVMRFPASAS